MIADAITKIRVLFLFMPHTPSRLASIFMRHKHRITYTSNRGRSVRDIRAENPQLCGACHNVMSSHMTIK